MCVERSEDKLKALVLGLRLRLSSLSNKCLCPLSHLANPYLIILVHWALCKTRRGRGLFHATPGQIGSAQVLKDKDLDFLSSTSFQ